MVREESDFKSRNELTFIRCTRNKDMKIQSMMCRSELLEAIVRLATTVHYPQIAHLNPVKAVSVFIENHLWPSARKNEQLIIRKILRSDSGLNDLLYDNRAITKGLYLYWRMADGFRLKSAFCLFNFDGSRDAAGNMDEDEFESTTAANSNVKKLISGHELRRIFLFSQMTVIDENMNYDKYYNLAFIEYLEMLCRAALKCNLSTCSSPKRKVEALL